MTQQTYYNTNRLEGPELRKAVENATRQEEAIFLIYLHTRKKWTPWDIFNSMTKAGKRFPITSIRRGITNLMQKGELIKTSETKPGEYNSPEHFYQLNYVKYPTPTNVKQVDLFG